MTLKKSFKLTAIGVGLVTIAITGCKNGSNDNKSDAAGKTDPKAEVSKPQYVKNFKAILNDIPLNGCAKYKISMIDQDGKEIEMNKIDNPTHGFSVNLLSESNAKFTINQAKNEVCANNESTPVVIENGKITKEPARLKDSAKISVLTLANNGLVGQATATVVEAKGIEKITLKGMSTSIALGESSDKFEIMIKNYGSDEEKSVTSAEKVKITDNEDNELKVSSINEKKEGGVKTYFTFKLSEKAKESTDSKIYYLSVDDFKVKFEVKVLAAKISKIELVKQGSSKAENIVNVGDKSQYDLLATYSDGKTKFLTQEANKYTIQSIVSDSPEILSVDSITAGMSAFANKINVNVIKAPAATVYKPVIIIVKLKNDNKDETPIKIPIYIANKPVVIANFEKTLEKTLDDGTAVIKTSDKVNEIKIPIGGNLLNKANHCAKLSANFTLGKATAQSISAIEIFNDFNKKIVLSNETDFEMAEDKSNSNALSASNITNFYVCARASAGLNAKTEAKIILDSDKSIESNSITITASEAIDTKRIVLNSDKKLGRPNIELVGSSASYTFNDLRILKTDHSVSTEKVSAANFDAEFTKADYATVLDLNKASETWTLKPKVASMTTWEAGKTFAAEIKITGKNGYVVEAKVGDNVLPSTFSVLYTHTK
jgi:hypothetical protein